MSVKVSFPAQYQRYYSNFEVKGAGDGYSMTFTSHYDPPTPSVLPMGDCLSPLQVFIAPYFCCPPCFLPVCSVFNPTCMPAKFGTVISLAFCLLLSHLVISHLLWNLFLPFQPSFCHLSLSISLSLRSLSFFFPFSFFLQTHSPLSLCFSLYDSLFLFFPLSVLHVFFLTLAYSCL